MSNEPAFVFDDIILNDIISASTTPCLDEIAFGFDDIILLAAR